MSDPYSNGYSGHGYNPNSSNHGMWEAGRQQKVRDSQQNQTNTTFAYAGASSTGSGAGILSIIFAIIVSIGAMLISTTFLFSAIKTLGIPHGEWLPSWTFWLFAFIPISYLFHYFNRHIIGFSIVFIPHVLLFLIGKSNLSYGLDKFDQYPQSDLVIYTIIFTALYIFNAFAFARK